MYGAGVGGAGRFPCGPQREPLPSLRSSSGQDRPSEEAGGDLRRIFMLARLCFQHLCLLPPSHA